MNALFSNRALVSAFSLFFAAGACAKTVATFDFTSGTHGWQGNHHTTRLTPSPEGLVFRSTGIDPWLTGPAVAIPDRCRLRVTVQIASDAAGGVRLFWGKKTFVEEDACNLPLPADGEPHEISRVITVKPGLTRFRLDPCAEEGSVTLRRIQIEALPVTGFPSLPTPVRPRFHGKGALAIQSGEIFLKHYQGGWGDWVIEVDGQEIAAGYTAEVVGVAMDDTVVFCHPERQTAILSSPGGLTESTWFVHDGKRVCHLTRTFAQGTNGCVHVTTRVDSITSDLMHVPWLTLFPGLGTFGQKKTQAVVPGVEYLADEPSSSKADILTAAHERIVPHPHKLCFPFAAVCHGGVYLALTWEKSDAAALVHDSPDRVFNSGAHLLALWGPNVGPCRLENDLVGHQPFLATGTHHATVTATLYGGKGSSVVPAVRQYVQSHPLPRLPRFEGGLSSAVELMAAGWTRSDSYVPPGKWRHAVWQGFTAQPAADACAFMQWLARHTTTPTTRDDLNRLIAEGLSTARTANPSLSGGVSHVRPPTAPFLFGQVTAYLHGIRKGARGALKTFDGRGARPYRKYAGRPDYSTTHFANHANGYGAATLCQVLNAALLTGDASLRSQAIALLDKQTELYANTVPRGAQTWELALHTPDILASAYMLNAYVLGYELTNRSDLLEQAHYWAWTGIPFIYLDRWTQGEIGNYATIPVLGATNWRAPLWIGRPVQWCGRVYAAMLERLARHDREGPWTKIAKGITLSALQQTWPTEDANRQGLLPDFFFIETQHRDGPAINPGTVESGLPFLYGHGAFFDSRVARKCGWAIHAPCEIKDFRETDGGVTFQTDGWSPQPYTVLLVGTRDRPEIVQMPPGATVDHVRDEGWLVIRNVAGNAHFHIRR